jgi:hypothetical protein
MISASNAQLKNRKILVVQVDAKSTLILTIVAHLHLHQSHQIGRHGKASEERHRVALKLQETLRLSTNACKQ